MNVLLSMECRAVALRLVYVEGGPVATPHRTRPADPPAEKPDFQFEEFRTREEAMARARDLIAAARVSGMALYDPGGTFVLGPHELAAELGVRLPWAGVC